MSQDINIPTVKAELEAVFADYERALIANDVAALDGYFLDHPSAVRYGIGENLYGPEAIAAYRRTQTAAGMARDLEGTTITTFGRDFGIASTLFRRASAPGRVGRQMQTWVRTSDGWRVAAAHISIIDG